jgi:hypothetical protein
MPATVQKRGPKPKKVERPLSGVDDATEPKGHKFPKVLERFRISGNNAPGVAPPAAAGPPAVAAPAAPVVPNMAGFGQMAALFAQMMMQTYSAMHGGAPAPAFIVPAGQPVVNHVSAAAIAGRINDPVDAAREVAFLKDALRNEQQRGHQPPTHLADVPIVAQVAQDYGPGHAPWQHAPVAPAAPVPAVVIVPPVPQAPVPPPAPFLPAASAAAVVPQAQGAVEPVHKKGKFIDLT